MIVDEVNKGKEGNGQKLLEEVNSNLVSLLVSFTVSMVNLFRIFLAIMS